MVLRPLLGLALELALSLGRCRALCCHWPPAIVAPACSAPAAARGAQPPVPLATQALLSDLWRWRRRGGGGRLEEGELPHMVRASERPPARQLHAAAAATASTRPQHAAALAPATPPPLPLPPTPAADPAAATPRPPRSWRWRSCRT